MCFNTNNKRQSDNSSLGKLPNDLETARTIIESLITQLKIHDDVTSNLILLQKKIQHTHQRTQDAIQMLEDRLDNIEATWTKELEDQHKRWLDKYNQLIREAENTRLLNKGTFKVPETDKSDKVKISKHQLEGLNRRVVLINEGIGEMEKVAGGAKNFSEKLQLDKQKIINIDARLKALTKKEQKLSAELTKQMKIHFRKPFTQMVDTPSEPNFYGVCEVIDGYQKTIENLDKALQTLEQVKKVPAMKSIDSTIQCTPSVDEVDEMAVVMRRFVAKLRVQLASVHSSNNPALSPVLHTDKSVPLTNSSSDLNSKEFIDATTEFGSSNRIATSDFGAAPLQTSQPVQAGSLSSSTNSQFLALQSSISSEKKVTKEKSSNETKQ
uniref:DUF641 domain-containing protein n=1 Tax=Setaria digitata TaxID=48799 RepID=A0A915PTJ3_9BILA